MTRVDNNGAAFGILKGQTGTLILVTGLFLLVFSYFLVGQKQFFTRRRAAWGWALTVSGALGNLFDRLAYGAVIDFLDFRIWPVFNGADTSICVGVGLLLWESFRKKGA